MYQSLFNLIRLLFVQHVVSHANDFNRSCYIKIKYVIVDIQIYSDSHITHYFSH